MTLLDVGANAEARREHLVQFAFMGAALARTVLGVHRPRVGLLSNGEESARGSELVLASNEELTQRAARAAEVAEFEFGSAGRRGRRCRSTGKADVFVTDGFTGNIALKLMEVVSQTILGAVREAAMSSTRARLGGALEAAACSRAARRSILEAIGVPTCSAQAPRQELGIGASERAAPDSHRAILRAERGALAWISPVEIDRALERAGR